MPPPTRPAGHAGGSFIPPVNGEGEPTLSTLARLVQQQSDVVSSQAELIGKLHESLRTLRDSSAEESEASRARIEALETRLRPLERLSQRTTALEAGADRMSDRVESLEAELANAVSQKKELERKMNELDLRARVRETRRPDVLRSSAAANAGPAAPSQAVDQVRAAESRARRTPESSTSSDVPLRLTMRGAENQRVPPQSVRGDAARTSQPGAAQASQPGAATRLSQPIAAAQPSGAPQTAATPASGGAAESQPCFTRLEFTAAGITERSVPSAFAYHHEEHAHAASPAWSPTSTGYSPPSPPASLALGGDAADAMQLDDVASNAATAQVGLGLDLRAQLSARRETSSSQTCELEQRPSVATGALAPIMPIVRVKMEPGLPSASLAHEPAASSSPASQLRALTTLSEHNDDSREARRSRDQDVQMSTALSGEINASERSTREQRAGASAAQSAAATAAGSTAQGTTSPAQVTTSSAQGATSSAPRTAPSLEQAQTPAQTPARPSLASRAVSAGRKRTHDGEQAQNENNDAAAAAAAAAQQVITASPVQMANSPRIKAEPEDDEVSFVSEKRPVKTAKALRAGAAASPVKPEPHIPAASQGRDTSAAAPASNPPTAPASLRAQEVSSRATPPRCAPAATPAAETALSRSASHVKTPSVARTATASLPQRPQRDTYDAAPQSGRTAQVPESEAVMPQARRASGSVGHSPIVSETRRTRTRNSLSRDDGDAQVHLAEAAHRSSGPSARAPDDLAASRHQADPGSHSPLPLSGYASVPFNESLKRPDLCWTDVKIGRDDWRIGIDFSAQYNSISSETLDCLQEQLGRTIQTKKYRDLEVCELDVLHFVFNAKNKTRSPFEFTHRFRILPRLAVGLILLGGWHDEGACRTKKTYGHVGHFFFKKRPGIHFPLVLPDAPAPRLWVDYSVFKAPAGRAASPEASTSASPASFDSQSGLSNVSTPPHPTAPLAQRLASTMSAPQGPAAERTSSGAAPVSAATASLIARLGPPEPKRRKP